MSLDTFDALMEDISRGWTAPGIWQYTNIHPCCFFWSTLLLRDLNNYFLSYYCFTIYLKNLAYQIAYLTFYSVWFYWLSRFFRYWHLADQMSSWVCNKYKEGIGDNAESRNHDLTAEISMWCNKLLSADIL